MTVIKEEKKMTTRIGACDNTEKYTSRKQKRLRNRSTKIKIKENEETQAGV